MTIKWTYTYTPQRFGSPIEIVGEDNKASVVIKEKDQVFEPITPPFPGINGLDDLYDAKSEPKGVNIRSIVTLKATITCGNYSYVLTKKITIRESSEVISALADQTETTSELTNSLLNEPQIETDLYRLVYENPVIAGSATIHVEKLENDEYVPYEGTYTLSLQGERVGLIQQSANGQPTCTFDCSNIPMGVYQLVLQIDGQVVATSKMLKLLY